MMLKTEVFEALILKWERNAIASDTQDGSDDAKVPNALAKGERNGRYRSAQDLKQLISLLCD